MANVHGLYSNKKDDSDDEKDESNNRYVGGIGDHGGGRWVSFVCFVVGRTEHGVFQQHRFLRSRARRCRRRRRRRDAMMQASCTNQIKTGWSGVVLVLIKLVVERNEMQQTGLPWEAGSCLDAGRPCVTLQEFSEQGRSL